MAFSPKIASSNLGTRLLVYYPRPLLACSARDAAEVADKFERGIFEKGKNAYMTGRQ